MRRPCHSPSAALTCLVQSLHRPAEDGPSNFERSYEPTHSWLDDINRLYAGVGVGDYVWYQNVFQDRIRAVYDEQGLGFLRRVLDRLSDPERDPESSAELLATLEEIAPGFIAWAEAYEQ